MDNMENEVMEEATEPVAENLENHEESDAEKWDKVFSAIDALNSRFDGFEKWVNETIGGIDKTAADEAEDTAATSGSDAEEEVADLDKAFYARQAKYLSEGGY